MNKEFFRKNQIDNSPEGSHAICLGEFAFELAILQQKPKLRVIFVTITKRYDKIYWIHSGSQSDLERVLSISIKVSMHRSTVYQYKQRYRFPKMS